MALALMGYGVAGVISSASSSANLSDAILTAIGYAVIAIATFDVAKYFIEEEVIRARELRIASEARRSLTKFISTIAIAVFIEGLVTVFRVSKDAVDQILYPSALLLTAVLIVVGLGVYQRLSADVEQRVEAKDNNKERKKA
jgi:tellurite resistance protein TehA-like permease